jgi:cation transport regulator ChaC
MRIACLGWGSLIWNPDKLPVISDWYTDGPWLPIEFARQSSDDRITLVCVAGFPLVQSLWALLSSSSLAEAREALREREGVPAKNIERDIGIWSAEHASQSELAGEIGAWAAQRQLDAVVWTNLPPKFEGTDGRIPKVEQVIAHLSKLEDEKRFKAEQYIRKAPAQIRTAYRAQIEQALGWYPKS